VTKFLGIVLLQAGVLILSFSQDGSSIQEKSFQSVVSLDGHDASFFQGFESFLFNLFSSEFGYTLVGAKPISIEELPKMGMYEVKEEYLVILKRMFENSPTFVLKIIDRGPTFDPEIELINIKALRGVIRENPTVNKFVRKKFLTEANFYSQLLNSRRNIFRVIEDDEIIGYILGYSKSNIKYYLRRVEIGRYLQKYPLYRFHPLPGAKYCRNSMRWNVSPCYKHIKPSRGFKSLEAEWQWIQDVAWDLDADTSALPPYFVSLPFYICRHGGDSELARNRFKQASCKVAELFYKKSFQEAISERARDSFQESYFPKLPS
jgi:hypothetical protein